jgi:hypothetical protein
MKQKELSVETYPCLIAFETWLSSARPNEKFVYFLGESLCGNYIGEILQRYTFDYAKKGSVYLVQQRYDTRRFNYIAIKASTHFAKNLVPNDYIGFPTDFKG